MIKGTKVYPFVMTLCMGFDKRSYTATLEIIHIQYYLAKHRCLKMMALTDFTLVFYIKIATIPYNIA